MKKAHYTFPTILLCALLVGCGESIESAPDAGRVITVPGFEWHVLDQAGLHRVYTEQAHMTLRSGQEIDGFAGYSPLNGKPVIYTLPPKIVDDRPTCTLGHEVLHLAIGNYHK